MTKFFSFKHIVIMSLACLLFDACSSSEKDRATQFLNEGILLFQEGKYSEAIEKYQEGLKLDPQNANGYNLLGMAFRFRFHETGTLEYREKEIESFKKAIEIDTKFWVAYKNISATLFYQGMKKEAVPYIEKALELQPNDPEKNLLMQWLEEGKKDQSAVLSPK